MHDRKELQALVNTLTREHPVAYGDRIMMKQSLLHRLREAFTEKGVGGGGSKRLANEKAPYNLNASLIYQEIAETAETLWRGSGRRTLGRVSLEEKLDDIALHTNDIEGFKKHIERWIQEIEDLDKAWSDLIGTCPQCEEAEQVLVDEYGSITRRTILKRGVGFPEVSCRGCKSTWQGFEVLQDLVNYL